MSGWCRKEQRSRTLQLKCRSLRVSPAVVDMAKDVEPVEGPLAGEADLDNRVVGLFERLFAGGWSSMLREGDARALGGGIEPT